MPKETYLGDGLYAQFDGYQFVLRAPRENGNHWVALNPGTLAEFNTFVQRTIKEINDERRNKTQ